ncbi:conserved hypothetical protein [Roseibium sp. TrichSKD4]|nr:conserved hypothetical protein [Roseibium sp. TrichSKD4]
MPEGAPQLTETGQEANMPSTVERPVPANVVAHATEYPTDREKREREKSKQHGNESSSQRTDDQHDAAVEPNAPAVVIDAHHLEDHRLDGVAAYRAAAKSVLVPGYQPGERHPLFPKPDRQAADTVRHAYEDHGDIDDPHAVNLAT